MWLVERTKQRAEQAYALSLLLWRTGRWLSVVAGLLTVLLGVIPIGIMVAVGVLVGAVPGVIEEGLDSPSGSQALLALGALAVGFVASAVGGSANTYAAVALSERYTMTVHDTVAGATSMPASVAPLEDPKIVGELTAVEEYDRTGVYTMTVQSLQAMVGQRTQAVAVFVLLLGFRWWAPFVLLAGWRLVNWAIARWVARGVDSGHDQNATGLRRARYWRGLALDAPAAKEIRVYGLASWVVGRYGDVWLSAMRELWRARRASWSGLLLAAVGLAASFGLVLAALASAGNSGAISVAALVIFAQAAMSSSSMGPLGDDQWNIGRALHGAWKVRQLERLLGGGGGHAEPPARAAPPGSGPVAVRVEELRFTYRGREQPTLDGLSLEVPPGQSLAIVGANGVGKSTLIKLLCGLYEPDGGRVVVDGITDPVTARRRIGVIFQDFIRYELPLRDNVGFGNIEAANYERDVDGALRAAGASGLLDILPAGWDSVLARDYEDGADLSGGQWQKVALARALMAVRGGAGLLILDEPTANLDVRAEAELFERFLEVTRGVTTILVSHRLSSVRHADRIVVIADGRVVEDGSHDELLAAGGCYASMYTLQAQRFAAADSSKIDQEVPAGA